MPTYRYNAMDGEGRQTRGTLSATDEHDAGGQLKARGLFPTTVTQASAQNRDAAAARGRGARIAPGSHPRSPFWQPRLKRKALSALTRQLATLLGAGMPLLRALRTLSRQTKGQARGTILDQVADQIEGGQTLSDALAAHPRSFNALYVNMVRAGEASGALEDVLSRQADFLEKAQRLHRRVKSALTYPITVCFIALLITSGLMVFVVPKFAAIFEQMLPGYQLPNLTRWVIAASHVLAHRAPAVVTLGVVALIGLRFSRSLHPVRYATDTCLLRTPPFGTLTTLAASARFCRTLGTLLRSGVPVLNSLQITRDSTGNTVVARGIQTVYDAVKEGEGFCKPMAASGVFPQMLVGMVEVGEETGALPEMLGKVAEIYEEEVDRAVDAMTALIEPAMIVFLAVVIGTIVIALFLPLIRLIELM